MADEAILTNISEMIDLAIGTPEIGVVDFSMLQTVLHCLAQQLRVLGKNVELRGSAAALPVGRPTENAPTIAISEFIVDTGAPGGYELAKQPPTPEQESMLVVERRRKVDTPSGRDATSAAGGQTTPAGGGKVGGGGPGGGGSGGGGGGGYGAPPSAPAPPSATAKSGFGGPPSSQAATAPPSGQYTTPSAPSSAATQGPRQMTATSGTGPTTEKLSLVTLSKFNLLEGTVADLKNRVYGTTPKNEDILQEVRSQGNLKAITDMWTNMNVSSRLDAAEEGIGKLSSLIEDLIGETVELQKATGSQPSAATSRMAEAAKAVTKAAQSPRGPPSGGGGPGYGPAGGQGMQGGQGVQGPPGAPGQPAPAYGPPGGQPAPAYGPPGGQPAPGYGPPGGQPAPGYGPPGGQPAPGYGPPGGQPAPGYGPPGGQPAPGYGPPGGQPAPGYGPPGGQPAPGYGPPGGQPAPGYGPPGGQPAPGYGPPGGQQGQAYGPPDGQQAQGYGPPGGGVQGPGGVMQDPGGVMQGPGGVMQGPDGVPFVPMGGYAPGAPGAMFDMSLWASKDELMQLLGHLQRLRNDLDILTETFYNAMKEVNENFEPPAALPPPSTIALASGGGGMAQGPGGGGMAQGPGGGGMGQGPGGAAALTITPGGGPTIVTQYQPLQMTPQMAPQPGINVLERLVELEKQLKKCCDTIAKSSGLVNDQLTSFQDQLEYMAKQIAGMSGGDLGTEKLSPDLVKDLRGLMQLFQTVQEMQTQLQQVHETALHLAAEKEDRQNHIDALLEQIELLKTIKLDREDMVEALADKADLRMLARKVSHDQFETACDDLSKGLEHALGKLNVQEALWQQALDDIQREIETKLDKMELSPVKEFFNNKLKQLQENLKQMAALRREAEAAGTKKRLLRDVNCISCDAKAVMSMDAPTPLPSKPLPATLSMKPYLSYELDAIRKAQASGLQQRNMHDWEHIDKQMQPRQPYKVRSDTDKHLCNRYCGGSHTVTTPAQRVARLGHFIKQWGPEVLPLSSGFAAGDDGRLYKISTVEGASVGPGGAVEGTASYTPKSPVKKPETPKGPKPLIISAECRCLDPAERPSKS